ncbi:unnamed protein product [Sphagnum tenellum]
MQNLKNIPASLLSQQHQETTTSSCSRSMNRRKSRSPIPSGGTSPLTARALGEEGAGGPPPPSLLLSSSSRISPFFTTSGSFSMANSSSSPRTTSAIFGRGGGQQTTLLRHDIIGHDLKQEFRLAFQLFDSRKVGRLSYREMKVAMRSMEFCVKKAEVKKLMAEYSKHPSGEIDHLEFMQIMTRKYKEKDQDDDLAKAFQYFDEDGMGKISLKNLRKVTRELGENITDEQLEAMIDEFDKDGDGAISKLEFFNIMKKTDPDE